MQNPDAVESPPPGGRTSIHLTIVASVAVWLLAILNLYHFRIADPDLWWYLRCGSDILQTGHIRQLDVYSFTAAGLPYLNHEWLTQVIFAFLVNHGGSPGCMQAWPDGFPLRSHKGRPERGDLP